MHEDVARKLIRHAKEYKGIDVTIGISEFVALLLDLRDNTVSHGAMFQPLAYHKDHVVLMDFRIQKPVKVYYKKNKVVCSVHKNDGCSHAGFAYTLEIVKRIISI
ncbi:MAG: hypothetical protein ACRDFB_06715 [Rhabdochlamydiaceae bacterium]